MPSGFKTCKSCGNSKVFSLVQKCSCGFVFYERRRRKGEKVKRKPNEKFRRLKKFVTRSFSDIKFSEEELSREVHVAKVMVEICYSDYDFIAKYTIPSWVRDKNTLLWFKTTDGKKYLKRKYEEYLFKPEANEDIFVDEGEIKGENINYKKRKSLRDFLDE